MASIAAPARTAIALLDKVRETMVILLFSQPRADDPSFRLNLT